MVALFRHLGVHGAVIVCSFLAILPKSAYGQSPASTHSAEHDAVSKGREFLLNLKNPELHLLPEFSGHNVIWLYHDNYLAAKVLEKSHPRIASEIMAAIRQHGVTKSGKIELLFGESKLPLHRYELRDVAKASGFSIRSEFTSSETTKDIASYADLLLFSAIGETDRDKAIEHWQSAMKMWDGAGFDDKAAKHMKQYATYKLALAIIAAKKLELNDDSTQTTLDMVRKGLLHMQSDGGGFITDYRFDGTPVGFANVETTCLAILALE